ncbi:post-PEP-CTERM-1 domain-containing protein [Massilia soli]|uniref:Secreted protein n=1 Tax=Massilia soli TaxID=2792854 RepID=A0ABS7SLN4_9BURK|nr:hypothetical protein [Massilia soli]MBZ2207088.1 hypothetical protein [Massilia soli]
MMNERSSPGATLAAMLALAALSLPPLAGAAGQEGMVVVRDRESGQLRAPTPAELRTLRAQQKAMAPTAPIAPSVQRPDGTRHLHLGERGMVYSVLSRDAAGREIIGCAGGEHAARAAIGQPAHSAPTGEHGHERE